MKHRRLNKAGKNLLIIMISIIVAIPLLCLIYQKSQIEVHIKKKTSQYEVNINYPIVYQKNLDNEIKKYVYKIKEEFLTEVNSQKETLQKPYTLTIQYQFYKEQNVYDIYLDVKIEKGDSGSFRDGKTFHYDSKKKVYLTVKDYIKDSNSLEQLSNLSYYYVMDELENQHISYDNNKIRELLFSRNDGFEHFHIKEKGIEMIYYLHQMIDTKEDTILKILIPSSETKQLLKEQYQILCNDTEKSQKTPEKRELSKYKNKKLVAFTFDDGPSSDITNYLLDGVNQFDAKVTFFILGNRIEQNQTVLKRAYQEGHEIGSHTYSHRNLLSLDDYTRMKEVKETNDMIEKMIGVKPTLLRPPYGNINQDIKKLSNMHIIEWNLDTMDWKYKDAEYIANEIVTNAHDGSIILLHDIYKTSVEGALLAMSQLEQDGYAFVTISEMAELRNIKLDYTTSYRYLY